MFSEDMYYESPNKRSKALYEYQFMKHNYGIEVQDPLFPLHQYSIGISKEFYRHLKQQEDDIFVTAVVSKGEKSLTNNSTDGATKKKKQGGSQKNELQIIQENNETAKQKNFSRYILSDCKNLIDYFHPIGTYCKGDLAKSGQGQYRLLLTGINRVNLDRVYWTNTESESYETVNELIPLDIEIEYREQNEEIKGKYLKIVERMKQFLKSDLENLHQMEKHLILEQCIQIYTTSQKLYFQYLKKREHIKNKLYKYIQQQKLLMDSLLMLYNQEKALRIQMQQEEGGQIQQEQGKGQDKAENQKIQSQYEAVMNLIEQTDELYAEIKSVKENITQQAISASMEHIQNLLVQSTFVEDLMNQAVEEKSSLVLLNILNSLKYMNEKHFLNVKQSLVDDYSNEQLGEKNVEILNSIQEKEESNEANNGQSQKEDAEEDLKMQSGMKIADIEQEIIEKQKQEMQVQEEKTENNGDHLQSSSKQQKFTKDEQKQLSDQQQQQEHDQMAQAAVQIELDFQKAFTHFYTKKENEQEQQENSTLQKEEEEEEAYVLEGEKQSKKNINENQKDNNLEEQSQKQQQQNKSILSNISKLQAKSTMKMEKNLTDEKNLIQKEERESVSTADEAQASAEKQENEEELQEEEDEEEEALHQEYQYEDISNKDKNSKNLAEFLVVCQQKIEDCPPYEFDIKIETKLKHLLQSYIKILAHSNIRVQSTNYNLNDGYRIIDSLGGFLGDQKYFKQQELYDVFQEIELLPRLEKLQSLMHKYLQFLRQFKELGSQAREQIFQKKYVEYQMEMFRLVKKMVKGKSRKEAAIAKLEDNLKGKVVPEEILEIFEREKARFQDMHEQGQEATIILNYLEWLSSMPFGKRSDDNYDLEKCQEVLDKHHYGMEDIKEKILEFIAVGKLKGDIKGKIVCLVGPPGTGKTSLAYSIADSLNRKFSRISCGGESDSAFLKGHRKTYIGAYPGKIIQALKECGTENCVILLDEVDKLGQNSFHGNPQDNLLEILDPEQNQNFVDNYMDVKIDLSNVLFICSANTTNSISEPLLDRMDMIELSSYTHLEKKQIYNKHLLPKILKESGIEEDQKQKDLFRIPESVVDILIKEYCREPGIRGLEKYTKKLIEKVAFEIVQKEQQFVADQEEEEKQQQLEQTKINQQQQQQLQITPENLIKLIGFPKYSEDQLFEKTPVGVVVGLAYTAYGGSLLYLESIVTEKNSKNPGIKVTGNLGKVMKESIQIAETFAKNFAYSYLNKNSFLEQSQIHIHAPEGAVPKDGPSAGITITSALISQAINTPLKQGVGMTGEISLRGKIMKIGGVKEKVLAAQRENIKELIFPLDNQDDVLDLKDEIKGNIVFHFVENYEQAFQILFPEKAQEYFKDQNLDSLDKLE